MGGTPTAEAGDMITVSLDEKITLDASDSKDNTRIVNYTWMILGENDVLYGPRPKYEFEKSGTYDVELTVRDENGNLDQDILEVNVKDSDTSFRYLDIIIPVIVLIIAITGLVVFFFIYVGSEEEETEDGEEEAITEYTKEELLQKLESGELSKKDLADMLAESHENLRKDIIEIYQYLDILKSKASNVRRKRGTGDENDKEKREED